MRGSDGVDLVMEFAPRRLVRVLMVSLAFGALVFGWTAAIEWYIADKAAGITELLTPVFEDMVADLVPSPAP